MCGIRPFVGTLHVPSWHWYWEWKPYISLSSRENECAAVRKEPSTSHMLISACPVLIIRTSSLEHQIPRHEPYLSCSLPCPQDLAQHGLPRDIQCLFNEWLLHWFPSFHFSIHSIFLPFSLNDLLLASFATFCCFAAIGVQVRRKGLRRCCFQELKSSMWKTVQKAPWSNNVGKAVPASHSTWLGQWLFWNITLSLCLSFLIFWVFSILSFCILISHSDGQFWVPSIRFQKLFRTRWCENNPPSYRSSDIPRWFCSTDQPFAMKTILYVFINTLNPAHVGNNELGTTDSEAIGLYWEGPAQGALHVNLWVFLSSPVPASAFSRNTHEIIWLIL